MYNTPPHPHPFTRMTRVTFFLGTLIGLLVADFVVALTVDSAEPLPLLGFLLLGAIWLLEWRREWLFVHFPAFLPFRGGDPASARANRALGGALMGFGLAGVDLCRLAFSLDFPPPGWLVILMVALVGSQAVTWYLNRRGHRRLAQP